MDTLGGRKFLAFLLLVAVGVGAETYTKAGLSMNLVYLLLGLYGAFTASNVGITLGTLKTVGKPSNDVQPAPAPADDDVAEQPAEAFQAPSEASAATFQAQTTAHAASLARMEETVKRLEVSLGQVVGSIAPQNEALKFLSQAEQRRQMREISG